MSIYADVDRLQLDVRQLEVRLRISLFSFGVFWAFSRETSRGAGRFVEDACGVQAIRLCVAFACVQ